MAIAGQRHGLSIFPVVHRDRYLEFAPRCISEKRSRRIADAVFRARGRIALGADRVRGDTHFAGAFRLDLQVMGLDR